MFKRMKMGDYIAADLRRRGLDQLDAEHDCQTTACTLALLVVYHRGPNARCNTYSVMADHRMLEDIFMRKHDRG